MTDPIISVIIPVYNVEGYLRECIDSVVSQYNDGLEIILVNDGSTDDSASICREYISKYKYIHIIEQSNQGLSEARNVGIRSASGEYIMFLDSDDYLNYDAIEKIQNIINYRKVDFVFGKAAMYYEDVSSIECLSMNYSAIDQYLSPCEIYRLIAEDPHFLLAAWMFVTRRQFIIENNLFFKKGILHEDMLWIPKVFTLAKNMSLLNYEFYFYRIGRTDSIMRTAKIKGKFDCFIIIHELSNFLIKLDEDKKDVVLCRMASLEYGVILNSYLYKQDKQINELWGQIQKNIRVLNYKKYRIVYLMYLICRIKVFRKIWELIGPIIQRR